MWFLFLWCYNVSIYLGRCSANITEGIVGRVHVYVHVCVCVCACACVVLLSGPLGHVIRSFVKIERMGAILTKTGIHWSSFPERRNTKIPSSLLLFSPEGNWGLLKLYLRERKELYPLSYQRTRSCPNLLFSHRPGLGFWWSRHSGNACWIDFLMCHTKKQKARHFRFFWNEGNHLGKGQKKEEDFFTSTNLDLEVSPMLILGLDSETRCMSYFAPLCKCIMKIQNLNPSLWPPLTPSLSPFFRGKEVSTPGAGVENRGWSWWRRLNQEFRVCTLLALIFLLTLKFSPRLWEFSFIHPHAALYLQKAHQLHTHTHLLFLWTALMDIREPTCSSIHAFSFS